MCSCDWQRQLAYAIGTKFPLGSHHKYACVWIKKDKTLLQLKQMG